MKFTIPQFKDEKLNKLIVCILQDTLGMSLKFWKSKNKLDIKEWVSAIVDACAKNKVKVKSADIPKILKYLNGYVESDDLTYIIHAIIAYSKGELKI